MSNFDNDQLEARLREAARAFVYPPTPDFGSRASRSGRRIAWRPLFARFALAVAILIAALLLVPDVRAAALRLFQIGVVQISVEPGPPTTPLPTPPPDLGLGLSGATTFERARELVNFTILLPAFPADLGPPDRVFLQDLGGDALVLVWLDPASQARPRLSLHILSSPVIVAKTLYGEETEILAETAVGGQPAFWVRGPHLLEVRGQNDRFGMVRIVPGNTLIWEQDGLTYRLESELSLEEALQVAESLR